MAGTKLNSERLLSELRTQVTAMRELGVVSWNGIVLGPEPLPKPKEEEKKRDKNYERRTYYQEVLGRSVSDAELKLLP